MCSAVGISGIRAGEDVNLVEEIKATPPGQRIDHIVELAPNDPELRRAWNNFRGFIFSFTNSIRSNTGLFTLGFPRLRAGLPKTT
jgi:hypothetical protein